MIEDLIKDAIKNKKIVFGYKSSIKFIKLNPSKLVVIARNIPERFKENIEKNAKIKNIKVEVFNGNSMELGAFCGKPFPISVLVIKE